MFDKWTQNYRTRNENQFNYDSKTESNRHFMASDLKEPKLRRSKKENFENVKNCFPNNYNSRQESHKLYPKLPNLYSN